MKTVRNFNTLYHQIRLSKRRFFLTFFLVVFVTYAFLVMIDFIPEPIQESESMDAINQAQPTEGVATTTANEEIQNVVVPSTAKPVSMYIEKLDKEITILNPTSNDIPTLDKALLSGAVRHPDSADFKEVGNIFILGHSSYLPNVLNKNFQAFNGIQNLTWGDKIYLASADTEYTYRVNKVYKAKASEVIVPSTPGEARLTLATCNSFGSKDDRYIVEAILIEDTVATLQE